MVLTVAPSTPMATVESPSASVVQLRLAVWKPADQGVGAA